MLYFTYLKFSPLLKSIYIKFIEIVTILFIAFHSS